MDEQEQRRRARPKKAGGGPVFGRIDRDHPISGEMSDILWGMLSRARLPWSLAHHSHVVVLALCELYQRELEHQAAGVSEQLQDVEQTRKLLSIMGRWE
jgi:hypothetical protein